MYSKNTYTDFTGTPIDAEHLNHTEAGIEEAHTLIGALTLRVDGHDTNIHQIATTAQNAQGAAEHAESTAASAHTIAEQAQAGVATAQGLATQAGTDAAAAKADAASAKTTANTAKTTADQALALAQNGGGSGGGEGGSANLGGVYSAMAILLAEFARQDGNLRLDGAGRDAAVDPSSPFVATGQARYFGQVGAPFEMNAGQVFNLFNFNDYPQDLVYTASADNQGETYDELPAGLTINEYGQITGIPTSSTMDSPYRVSATWFFQTSATVPEANSTALVEFVIFPAN